MHKVTQQLPTCKQTTGTHSKDALTWQHQLYNVNAISHQSITIVTILICLLICVYYRCYVYQCFIHDLLSLTLCTLSCYFSVKIDVLYFAVLVPMLEVIMPMPPWYQNFILLLFHILISMTPILISSPHFDPIPHNKHPGTDEMWSFDLAHMTGARHDEYMQINRCAPHIGT